MLCNTIISGGSRISGRGGLIIIFTSGVGTGGGVPPPVTARGSGGALSSPSGGWGEAPAAFSLLRSFSMKISILLKCIQY